MTDGLLLFARYAYPPNLLGYCGPDDHDALRGYLHEASVDAGLGEIARRFDGAYPYLRLIAQANGIRDPFDRRVVEAYWIGNALLERVGASVFFESLTARFRGRMKPREFTALTGLLPRGARPHHNFHVFDIYRRAGLLRDERAVVALERMDHCRISWGTVRARAGLQLVVDRQPLVLQDGRLALGPAVTVTVSVHPDTRAQPGDHVSLHWGWACDRLGPGALQWLRRSTQRTVSHANLTL